MNVKLIRIQNIINLIFNNLINDVYKFRIENYLNIEIFIKSEVFVNFIFLLFLYFMIVIFIKMENN